LNESNEPPPPWTRNLHFPERGKNRMKAPGAHFETSLDRHGGEPFKSGHRKRV
jgi:hypothetical protein